MPQAHLHPWLPRSSAQQRLLRYRYLYQPGMMWMSMKLDHAPTGNSKEITRNGHFLSERVKQSTCFPVRTWLVIFRTREKTARKYREWRSKIEVER